MKLSRFFQDSLIYTFSVFLSKGINFLLLPFYTRIFSAEYYGALDIIAVFVLFSRMFFSFQIDQAIPKFFIPAKHEKTKQSFFSTGLLHYILVFGVVSTGVVVFRESLSLLLFDTRAYSGALLFAGLVLSSESLLMYLENQLKWEFKSGIFTAVSIIKTFLTAGLVYVFAAQLNFGVQGVFMAYLFSNIPLILFIFLVVRKRFNLQHTSFKRWWMMSKFGIPLIFCVLALQVIQYSDRLFIAKYVDLSATGVYSVGIKLSMIAMLVFQGFGLSFVPYILQIYKEAHAKETIAKIFRWIFSLSGLVVLGLILFTPLILVIMTTPAFYQAYKVVPIIVFGSVMFQFASQFSIGYVIKSKTNELAYFQIVGAGLNLILNAILVPQYGAIGAALATSISLTLLAVSELYRNQAHFHITYPFKGIAMIVTYILGVTLYNHFVWGMEMAILVWLQKFVVILGFVSLLFFLKLITVQEIKTIGELLRQKRPKKNNPV